MIQLARFVSNAREYSVVCWRTIDRPTAFQLGEEQQQGFIADFRVDGSLSPWETDAALKELGFLGIGDGEDVTHRLSVYDTEIQAITRKWTPEFRQRVEDALRASPSYGSRFIEVEMPRAPAPWPAYDKLVAGGRGVTNEVVAEKIVAKVREDGYNPELVIAYERQNTNRVAVIEALEQMDAPVESEPLVTA